VPSASPPSPKKPPSEESRIETAAKRWNDAHNSADPNTFTGLYGNNVYFYGRKISGKNCADTKVALLKKDVTFRQSLAPPIRVIIKGDRGHASFVKEVTSGGKTKKYRSYLEFAREGDEWVIVTEGDEQTDRALAPHNKESVGDFDGDGAKETVRLVPPQLHEDGMGCEGEETVGCNCKLVFSDPKLPEIPVNNCIGGVPVNEGDLDDDGTDEIGLLPWWFTSCWHSYLVFTLEDGKPETLASAMTHCVQWDDRVDAIEKDPNRPGHVTIRSTSMEDFSIIEQSVRVKK
jgi:hypothetical protein